MAACGPIEARTKTLEVRVHELAACALPAVPTDRADVRLTLRALGPFPASNAAAQTLSAEPSGRALRFPDDTRGVDVVATDGEERWLGYSDRLNATGIDVSLWQEGVPCALVTADSGGYPAANAGQAVGYSAARGALFVAGGDVLDNRSAAAIELRTDTGAVQRVTAAEAGLKGPRAFATASEFGSGMLVAGGENPFLSGVPAEEREPYASAEVYEFATQTFASEPVRLVFERTRHAAIVLPSGETLLVGGRSGFRQAVRQLEAVSPRTRTSGIGNLDLLEFDRIEPVAFALDDRRIFVGGGYDLDGAPVTALEWLEADAGSHVPELVAALPPRHHRAFAALPGGGVLSVGGCVPTPSQGADCLSACGEGHGCPAPDADAWWIGPDAALEAVELDIACPRPLLASGSDGSPWLIGVDCRGAGGSPEAISVRRFDPWRARFASGRVGIESESPPDPRFPLLSLGADAFAWLTASDPPALVGMRSGIRGALSPDPRLIEATDPFDAFRPLHLAPDRPTAERDSAPALFDPQRGGLTLEPNEPVTVLVTDTRYENVNVRMEFDAAGAPPVVVFGGEPVGDNDACRWPRLGGGSVLAERRGATVTLTRNGTDGSSVCAMGEQGPVSLGLRAGAERAVVRALEIIRH